MELVINERFGGFGLSSLAMEKIVKLKGGDVDLYDCEIERNDPDLIKVVKEMGSESWGKYAKLKIVEIPDNVEWTIEEYDGNEWIAEKHRTWQ